MFLSPNENKTSEFHNEPPPMRRSQKMLRNLKQNVNLLLQTSRIVRNVQPKVPNTFRNLHLTSQKWDLMEFFDEPKSWGKDKVRVGRSWKTDELRLKSNEDLHKLWYVLLKERNMLLTMIEAYKEENVLMPNPERLDKVEESMENLEGVVRERNRAYYELEVGGSGEQEREIITGCFGLEVGYTMKEQVKPIWHQENLPYYLKYRCRTNWNPPVLKFYRRMREQHWKKFNTSKNKQLLKAANTIKRFPNTKKEALEEWFPDVKYDEVIRYQKSKGNHRNDKLDVPPETTHDNHLA